MSLVLPQEIVGDRVLPTLRAMLARRLSDKGLTQQAIAANLGVTQAAVSKYAAGDVIVEERIQDDPRARKTADEVAAGIAEEDMDEYDVLAELLDLVETLEDRGPICDLHEEAMPALQGLGCDLCVRGSDATLRAERAVLGNVRKAARILSTTPGMARVIPNVGTNVGMGLEEAQGVEDVAAIPGRIYAVDGRVEVPAQPEFGASRNVATAVLAARGVDESVRAAINLAATDDLLETVRDREIDAMEFDPDYDDREIRLRDRFADRGSVPRVAYHTGAFGIEPITYVFGESAVEAAEYVSPLVESLND